MKYLLLVFLVLLVSCGGDGVPPNLPNPGEPTTPVEPEPTPVPQPDPENVNAFKKDGLVTMNADMEKDAQYFEKGERTYLVPEFLYLKDNEGLILTRVMFGAEGQHCEYFYHIKSFRLDFCTGESDLEFKTKGLMYLKLDEADRNVDVLGVFKEL